MYNGIGLQTSRGTGTNGFVQRNLSYVRVVKERVEYKPDDELKKLEAYANRKGNAELLLHDRKRKIELKCVEMEDLMSEQGFSEEEIERKVEKFRKQLLEKESQKDETQVEFEYDEFGRPIANETHKIAEANDLKNKNLREAFGLGEFEPSVRAKQLEEERKLRDLHDTRYQWVDEDDIDDDFDNDYDTNIKNRRMASKVIEVNKPKVKEVEVQEIPKETDKKDEKISKKKKQNRAQAAVVVQARRAIQKAPMLNLKSEKR